VGDLAEDHRRPMFAWLAPGCSGAGG
jgi:hypothetical protein